MRHFIFSVNVAHDGQECHDCFALNPAKVDVILMELKVTASELFYLGVIHADRL